MNAPSTSDLCRRIAAGAKRSALQLRSMTSGDRTHVLRAMAAAPDRRAALLLRGRLALGTILISAVMAGMAHSMVRVWWCGEAGSGRRGRGAEGGGE